jgi:hypothetical protein
VGKKHIALGTYVQGKWYYFAFLPEIGKTQENGKNRQTLAKNR